MEEKLIITQIGFENNNIIAFYRRQKYIPHNKEDLTLDWTQMQAIKVRYYWYKIFYERLPKLIKSCNRKIMIYEDL